MISEIKTPLARKLRIPSGWVVRKMDFYDLEPDVEPKFKAHEYDDGWRLFESELLVLDYKFFENIVLDMGWVDPYSPDGRFMLGLVYDGDWLNEQIICETRSLQKITDAINNAMLRISLENGEYPNGLNGQSLQELYPRGGWKFVKNEFFDLAPNQSLTAKEWKLFHENLLLLEGRSDEKYKIEMSWFPAHNPDGAYVAKLINENLDNSLLDEFSTTEKAEIVEYLNQAMNGRMSELSNKRERSEKERRRQQRLTEQRNAQAK